MPDDGRLKVERQIDLGHLITNDCTVGELLRRYLVTYHKMYGRDY